MRGIEADRQAERLVSGIAGNKPNRLVTGDVGEVTGRTIKLLLCSTQRDEGIEHRVDSGSAALDLDAELSNKTCAITGRLQLRGVTVGDVGPGDRWFAEGVPVCALNETRENRRSAGGTDAGGDKRVGEATALCGERVDVRRLDDRVTGTAQHIGAVVIGEKEDEVWAVSRKGARHAHSQKQCDESRAMFH